MPFVLLAKSFIRQNRWLLLAFVFWPLVLGAFVWAPHHAAAQDEVMDIMSRHQIRRVPVIENKRLVGIISQADVARRVPEQRTGQVVEEISADR